jgi:UDP-galactose transporter
VAHSRHCRCALLTPRLDHRSQVVMFQVLYQSKLMLTAILSVVFLRRQLTGQQWLALIALTAGVVAVELSDGSVQPSASASERKGHRAWLGIASALLAALLSSIAGVYFEAIVKKTEAAAPSLWTRNLQLCIFTIPVALVAVCQQPTGEVRLEPVVRDAPTVLLCVLNASGGLLVAAVIKYGDNILKNFTTSCSVILGTLISVAFFGFRLSLQARAPSPRRHRATAPARPLVTPPRHAARATRLLASLTHRPPPRLPTVWLGIGARGCLRLRVRDCSRCGYQGQRRRGPQWQGRMGGG